MSMKFYIKYLFLIVIFFNISGQSYAQVIEKNSVIDLLTEAQFDEFLDE